MSVIVLKLVSWVKVYVFIGWNSTVQTSGPMDWLSCTGIGPWSDPTWGQHVRSVHGCNPVCWIQLCAILILHAGSDYKAILPTGLTMCQHKLVHRASLSGLQGLSKSRNLAVGEKQLMLPLPNFHIHGEAHRPDDNSVGCTWPSG